MARRGKKKTRAAAAASAALKGQATTPLRQVDDPTTADILANARQHLGPKKEKFLDRRLGRTRLTWRAVLLFLLAMLLLDVVLYGIVDLGFGQCYGILCLFN